MYTLGEKIVPREIEEEIKDSYLSYAMSVIVGRALPDARDGLKPVHRRILYAMQDLGLVPGRPYKKSASVVGNCLAKYHPHGDMAVYDTLVRMVQDFSLRYPLIDGQGNFGCFTGDTKIRLVDGTVKSFEELAKLPAEQPFCVYSVNRGGQIAIGVGRRARVTRRQATLVEVTLDSGEKVRCTPDHRFLLRDGTYKQAQDLTPDESLMAGYFDLAPVREERSNDYLRIRQLDGTWTFVHWLADAFNLAIGRYPRAAGRVRHHKDFNRFNNSPDNIERLSIREHNCKHAEPVKALWQQEGFRLKQRDGVRRFYKDHPEIREAVRQRIIEANRTRQHHTAESEAKRIKSLKALYENSPQLKGLIKRPLDPETRRQVRDAFLANNNRMWTTPDMRERIVAALKAAMSQPRRREEASRRSKALWRDAAYRAKYAPGHHSRMAKIVEYASRLATERGQAPMTAEIFNSHRPGNWIPRHEKAIRYFDAPEELFEVAARQNHRVVTVRSLSERADVYDITVDEHHNFLLDAGVFVHNSVDGDNAAAYRYTEARLQAIAMELLADIDKDTVDFVPNFDNSLTEPKVLPAKLPNLLVNGSSGIAVGMATNIPPHNLGEIVDAACALIDEPDLEVIKLMRHVRGPDFPTGAIICGREGIKDAYTSGRGSLRIRAKIQTEQLKGNRQAIVITELPYQVNKANLIESIAKLVQDKNIEGISDLRDESDKEGMRVMIELKRDANDQVVLNQLYKHTQMETTFGVIMLALVDGRPRVLGLKQLLQVFIDHRKDVVIRRTKFELAKAQERAHIVEGLKKALAHLDAIIKTIRQSKSPQEAKEALVRKFDLSEKQAQAILEMQLQRLTALERDKLEAEYLELIKKIESYQMLLKSERNVLEVIKEELQELRKKYSDERRTEIVGEIQDLKIEDLIAEEDVVIMISHRGYIKRLPVSAYRKQRRGGVGVTAIDVQEEDFVEHLFVASTHETLMFFTNQGRCYWLKVHEVPQAGRYARGTAIANLLSLQKDEQLSAFVSVKVFAPNQYLLMATRQGTVKKTKLEAYSNPRKTGIIAITLEKGDELIEAKIVEPKRELSLITRRGKAIRFPEEQVREVGRSARGVHGIRLDKDDAVVSMALVEPKGTLLTVTRLGFGKRTTIDEYRLQSRGGKGIINISVTKRNGEVIGAKTVTDRDEIMLISQEGMMVRCPVKDVRATGRAAQGVRLINIKGKDIVASIASVAPHDEEADKTLDTASAPAEEPASAVAETEAPVAEKAKAAVGERSKASTAKPKSKRKK